METFDDLSNEELADEITTLAGRLAAAEARQLALIGEFDRREAWGGPGLLSCAHWLAWRTGMSPVAARERVRVARALRTLPVVAEAFAAGKLSFSQVRAITRVELGLGDGGARLVNLARYATAAQLERIVRGLRRAQAAAQPPDNDAEPVRVTVRKRYDPDGTCTISIRTGAEHAAVIMAALEQTAADIAATRRAEADPSAGTPADVPADTPQPGNGPATTDDAEAPAATAHRRVGLGDALLAMARDTLDRIAADRPSLARRHRTRLTAHRDPLSGWLRLHDGEFLPPPPADLTACDLGRTRREPTLALRELLGAIDGEHCRMPGCTRTRHLHAHHVLWWSKGGPTNLSNLVLLCTRHHTAVHERGFQLVLHPDRRLHVTAPDGSAIPHRPPLPWQPLTALDPDHIITPHTLPPDMIDARIDLDWIVAVTLQQAA